MSDGKTPDCWKRSRKADTAFLTDDTVHPDYLRPQPATYESTRLRMPSGSFS